VGDGQPASRGQLFVRRSPVDGERHQFRWTSKSVERLGKKTIMSEYPWKRARSVLGGVEKELESEGGDKHVAFSR
jgi:hypothetical protein